MPTGGVRGTPIAWAQSGIRSDSAAFLVTGAAPVILHLATFVWRDGVTTKDIEPFMDALAELPGQIPELRKFVFGPDLNLREGNGDFGVWAALDGPDAFAAYVANEPHQRAVRDLAMPFAERRTAVQIDAGDLELGL